MYLYVDESLHPKFGFIVTAFVFSHQEMEEEIRAAILAVGLDPEKDEYKSGTYMANNPAMQELRERLFNLLSEYTKIALLFSPPESREDLGLQCLQNLGRILRRNGYPPGNVQAFFDTGIFRNSKEAKAAYRQQPSLAGLHLHPEEDSVKRSGIQLADLVAHSVAQLIRDEIKGSSKEVKLRQRNDGIERASLTWLLYNTLRRAFLTRQMVYKSGQYDPDKAPVILNAEDDPATIDQNPEMLGWGLHLSPGLDRETQKAIKAKLGKAYLGCMH